MLDRVFIVSLDKGLLIFEAQYGSKSSVEPMKLSSLFYSITKLALSQPNRSSVGLDERNLIKIQKVGKKIGKCCSKRVLIFHIGQSVYLFMSIPEKGPHLLSYYSLQRSI